MTSTTAPLLEVEELRKYFTLNDGTDQECNQAGPEEEVALGKYLGCYSVLAFLLKLTLRLLNHEEGIVGAD